MATISADQESGEFSIGRIFQTAFGTIASNPVVAIGMGLLFGAVPAVAMAVAIPTAENLGQSSAEMLGAFGVVLLTTLASLVIGILFQGVMTRATVAHSEGRKASLSESLRAAFAVFLPLLGVAVLIGAGVMFGLMLLLVPGVILYVMWSVATPAMVEERRGVFGSLARSRALTRGHRWKVFGTLLVMFVFYYFIAFAFGLAGLESGFQSSAQPISATMLILTALSGTITSLIWSLVQAATYVELRRAADGLGETQLEDVFA